MSARTSLRLIQAGYIASSALALTGLSAVIGGVITAAPLAVGLGALTLGLALALSVGLDLLTDRRARAARAAIEAEQERLLAELHAGASRAMPDIPGIPGIPVVTNPYLPKGTAYLVGDVSGNPKTLAVFQGLDLPEEG